MKSQVVPRAQCIAGARAVLDQARRRIAADYAAGRLSPEQTAQYERLIAKARVAAAA
ncbi:hypothetical protein ABZ135_29485 [Streptomyces sp. NPDC006339]|uniref:hypothetical protein n=1 Tax=Streptomyces sp. NPDC006339 TaxID=3156755 RepID=UPI0033A3E6EE